MTTPGPPAVIPAVRRLTTAERAPSMLEASPSPARPRRRTRFATAKVRRILFGACGMLAWARAKAKGRRAPARCFH
jgi:hypothetical protein